MRRLQVLKHSQITILALILSAAAVATVHASEFQCKSGQDHRFIRIDYPGRDHLCEVSVTKRDNTRDVKWWADFDSTFCSDKIVELVGKYQNLWGYSCEEWPSVDGIEKLSLRHRKLLDDVVKQTLQQATNDSPPYAILGTRALAGEMLAESTAQTLNLLAIQFFMTRVGAQTERDLDGEGSGDNPATDLLSPVNRMLIIEDDGESHRTLTSLPELKDHIQVDKEGYSLDSVVIDTMYSSGEFDVSTLVSAPGDHPEAAPSCYGQQRFKATDDGVQSVDKHRFVCDL